MDVIEQFIADECVVNEGEQIGAKELFDSYKKWAEDSGEYNMNKNKYGKKMKEKFESKKSGSIYYLGLNIKERFPGLANFSN